MNVVYINIVLDFKSEERQWQAEKGTNYYCFTK